MESNCTIRVAKTKALSNCEADLRLCFRTGKNQVSRVAAQIIITEI